MIKLKKLSWKDERGTSTIEFLIALPLLLFLLLVCISGFHVFLSITKYARAGNTVTDVISRYGQFTQEELDLSHNLLASMTQTTLADIDMRVSRITYLSKDAIQDGDSTDISEWYETTDGFYNVDESLTASASLADGEDPADAQFKLKNDDLVQITFPSMGDHSHIIYVEMAVPYDSPVESQLVDQITSKITIYNNDILIAPRDPRGIDIVFTPAPNA
ncbi:MAG: hypothetical protein AAF429_09680 [Pseudomonadota bacterium]